MSTDQPLTLTDPDGVQRLLIGTGPVVGRELAAGRVVVWDNPRDFYATYEEQTR